MFITFTDIRFRMHKDEFLSYLQEDPTNVLKYTLRIHHAPAYIKKLANDVFIGFEFAHDTPSADPSSIVMRNIDLEKIMNIAHTIEKVNISESPYKQKDRDTIPDNWCYIYKHTDEYISEPIIQYIVQYENNEFGVYTQNTDSYIFPQKAKVIDNITTENCHRYPITMAPINGSLYEF